MPKRKSITSVAVALALTMPLLTSCGEAQAPLNVRAGDPICPQPIRLGKVFTDPVANYNKGFRYIWNEVPVVVTFESDWRKAKHILGKMYLASFLTGVPAPGLDAAV